jgi:hypothetical protein
MLRKLFQISTPSSNPSSLTGILPGGAGVTVTGTSVASGISAPTLEPFLVEVQDVTAPTLLTAVTGKTTPGTPAVAGALVALDAFNSGPGGWNWKLVRQVGARLPRGQYGIVYKPANILNAGVAVATAGGNISQGDRAEVCIDGPVPALVTTVVFGAAISAGMPLQSDGGGYLTGINLGTTSTNIPLPGQVLATSMDFIASGVSTPVLRNVYVGGY